MEQQLEVNRNYGLETILKRIKPKDYVPFEYLLTDTQPDFKVVQEKNPKFIAPVLSVVNDYSFTTDINNADIILIEAVGASGKTELTKYMSNWLKCPVFNLGLTKVVAGNSLTGLMTKRMDRKDTFAFMDNISSGRSTLIIDALDEGYIKTNNQGYLDFLDDVLSLKPQKGCPIIMSGRYNAIELAASFLFDKGEKFITLQIEPFTLQQAKEFIDKAVESVAKLRFESIYKLTRDYILYTINGFFKDQSSIKSHASERFIGYAPVLLSIAAFFDNKTNYHAVLDDLKGKNIKSVELIIDIIERILNRDKDEKVCPILLNDLLAERSVDFQKQVIEVVYDFDEQCARVLYKVLQLPFPEIEINDASFIAEYNKHIDTWVTEHPFLGKKRIANIVFESYILARLTRIPKYKDAAYKYIKKFGISYMFAYIYYALYKFDNIDPKILPYIYESLSELNNKAFYTFCLESTESISENHTIKCEFEFIGSNESMTQYSGSVSYQTNDVLSFGARLEYVNLNVPLDFILECKNVEAIAPSYIKCKNLFIESNELTIHNQINGGEFMFECEDIVVSQKYEQYLQITGPGKTRKSFCIICPKRPEYPLLDYWTSVEVKLDKLSDDETALYKKLRSIILEFRSHSKHELAKHHEKIDFVLGANQLGQRVIRELKNKKIMYKDGHLYKLDSDLMSRELGLSYDDIRNYEINDQVMNFLRGIE